MREPTETSILGLRERKKLRTRTTIQHEALRLFAERGYDAVTVEEICAAAEVSDTTFYRYFAGKAHVVLWDEFDPLIVAAFEAQPVDLPPIRALRRALQEVFSNMTREQHDEQRQRANLMLGVPELRATMADQFFQGFRLIVDSLLARTGRASGELATYALAGAVGGAALAVMYALAENPDADFASLFDQMLDHFEHGLAYDD